MEVLREKWNETQLGRLAVDPVMKPFVDDLRRQLRSKLNQTDARLGIGWEDLEGVYGGEVCVAVIQPWDQAAADQAVIDAGKRAAEKARAAGQKPEQIAVVEKKAAEVARLEKIRERQQQHAMALLVDVTDHVEQANQLLDDITRDLIEQGATKDGVELAGVQMVRLQIPVDKQQDTKRPAFYVIQNDVLVAADNEIVATEILQRMNDQLEGSLAETAAFQKTASHNDEALGEQATHLRWFVEPFGLIEVARAYGGGRKKRGTDILKVLANQGFTAIQGLGGSVALSTGEHELLQQMLVYAPAVERPEGSSDGEKYDLAARMLDFPNGQNLQPQPWVPRELATYLTFNWKMQNAFWFAETLVNEFAGDEVFLEVLKSIETDPNGPQINIKNELIDHLGERATLMADCQMPITPESERLLVAIELTDPATVMNTVNKAMESDPEARRLQHKDHVIWEMIREDEIEVEAVQIDGPGFGFGFDEPVEEEEEDVPFRPNAAVTVAKGHLVVASHVDYIVGLLDRSEDAESLEVDGEFQLVDRKLDKLGAGDDAFRFFTRTDEAYRTTYELLRQGRMPEAESLLGKLLNHIFEPEEEGVLREQQIDGSKLPEFQVARRYLGPAGFYLRTVDDGWVVTACLISKESE
jgi:hypothetical protein